MARAHIRRYGSYGEFARARSAEWLHSIDEHSASIGADEAWRSALHAISAAPELNYLTMIVCRVYEVHRSGASGAMDHVLGGM